MKTAWAATFMSAVMHLEMFRTVVNRNGDPNGTRMEAGRSGVIFHSDNYPNQLPPASTLG